MTTTYHSALDVAQDRLDAMKATLEASARDPLSVGGPALPAGADFGDIWETTDGSSHTRVVSTPSLGVTDHQALVWADSVQDTAGRLSNPAVRIDIDDLEGLNFRPVPRVVSSSAGTRCAAGHLDHHRGGAAMTTSLQPIECTPWCADGDGHPDQVFRSDQWCHSPLSYVDSSLADGEVSAHARRDVDCAPVVELHIYGFGELDETLHFTGAEARQLAANLVDAADLIEGLDTTT